MLSLDWMRADAPYMPIASAGLLAVLGPHDPAATVRWAGGESRSRLLLDCRLDLDEVAAVIADAPLPDIGAVPWPTANPQALGPSLQKTRHPLGAYRELVRRAGPLEARLLRAIATDQVMGDDGIPSRTRLLRGAKSDISAFKPRKRPTASRLVDELRDGPMFTSENFGSSLGLIPELHTFGGTTGRNPSDINASSALLSLLLLHGILDLPPGTGARRGRRVVGGPLFTESGALSWPRWTFAAGPRALRALFSFAAIHDQSPDVRVLRARGVDAVFRSESKKISTTVSVFRWGRRVA